MDNGTPELLLRYSDPRTLYTLPSEPSKSNSKSKQLRKAATTAGKRSSSISPYQSFESVTIRLTAKAECLRDDPARVDIDVARLPSFSPLLFEKVCDFIAGRDPNDIPFPQRFLRIIRRGRRQLDTTFNHHLPQASIIQVISFAWTRKRAPSYCWTQWDLLLRGVVMRRRRLWQSWR